MIVGGDEATILMVMVCLRVSRLYRFRLFILIKVRDNGGNNINGEGHNVDDSNDKNDDTNEKTLD